MGHVSYLLKDIYNMITDYLNRGIAYYFVTGIGVWIEGIGTKHYEPVVSRQQLTRTASLDTSQLSTQGMMASRPSTKSFLAIILFAVGSTTQHICHRHLASLKKYTLPYHPLFRSIICPHYTSECLIYLALAIGGAPPGKMLNKTILSGFLFVVANLSVTANSTRNWYMNKFGVENVKDRWRIIPLVY
jgi:3-oxo-5-alpha-steroid 4-dehydrogenase 3